MKRRPMSEWLGDVLRVQAARHHREAESSRGHATPGVLRREWLILAECQDAAAEVYERKLKELEEKNGT